MKFDRTLFFNSIRESLFPKGMSQQQVEGMEFKLSAYEANPLSSDLRHLAYPFATSYHETARTMWPIEEIGQGKGKKYGIKDKETQQVYFGRGDVQLTWRENYSYATKELGLTGGPDDLEWHADRALDPTISANVMYHGMEGGWFTGKALDDFFNSTKNDPTGARIIINNDVKTMGARVAGYYEKFLVALRLSEITTGMMTIAYRVEVTVPDGTPVEVKVVRE